MQQQQHATAQGGGGGAQGQSTPPEDAPSLEGALLRGAKVQAEDADIVADMQAQGKAKPSNYATWRDFITSQRTVVPLAVLEEGSNTVSIMHSVNRWSALGSRGSIQQLDPGRHRR